METHNERRSPPTASGEAFTYGRKLKIEATNLIIGKIERLVSALLCEYVEFTSSLSMGNK